MNFRKQLRTSISAISLALAIWLSGCPSRPLTPPTAKIEPKTTIIHSDTLIDNYAWLREKSNPEVIQYLEDENAYTEAIMKPTRRFQKKLYKEMLARIKETDESVPVKIDSFYYYNRMVKGNQYPLYCRKKGSLDANEEILLDQNRLASGQKYCSIGEFKVSPDHSLLAFAVDFNGSEKHMLVFKDLINGQMLPDTILDVSYGLEWANDNRTVFYTTLDTILRPDKLWRHQLGQTPENDVMVFHEPDEKFYLGIAKTRSHGYLILTLGSQITTEVHYLSADQPDGHFRLFCPRQTGVEYYIDHHSDKFYILTNENAINFRLLETPIARPEKHNWQEKISHRPNVMLTGIDLFCDHLVVYERENGLEQIRVENLNTGATHYIDFPEPVYTIDSDNNPDYNTKILRFRYTSLVTPNSVYDYDMESQTRELKKQDEVLGGYDQTQYQSERIYAVAKDGVRIPISLVYKKGMKKDGSNPFLLYGYGAYGIPSEARFSSIRLSLLDRGFIYAIAHVRGGGELGRQWYEDGKLLRKRNTFTDFIACAEMLIAEKYTSAEKLVINGGSAGGLLMGAVVNMRPELFEVVVAEVPFVDLINTMLDRSIPLTVIEWEEWGNPHLEKYYNYMKSYSPYDNVGPKAYPHMLITAGLNDPRVAYWEPAKWTAKLRAMKTDDNVLLLKTDMGKGHFSASGRYDYLKEVAFKYAFIFAKLGIRE
ncbi:MAG TPA: S9 family peptidase [Candidatus Marinimicrobia bacterium]|nr:S9 family peptidase [Candidatus Neomarinimicrobiota bacterium]